MVMYLFSWFVVQIKSRLEVYFFDEEKNAVRFNVNQNMKLPNQFMMMNNSFAV